MNHCTSCGRPVSAGRTDKHASDRKRAHNCLVCIQARILRSWRYVTPAMRRRAEMARRARKEGTG